MGEGRRLNDRIESKCRDTKTNLHSQGLMMKTSSSTVSATPLLMSLQSWLPSQAYILHIPGID